MYYYAFKITRNENKEIIDRKCMMRTLQDIGLPVGESVVVPSDLLIEPEYALAEEVDGKLVVVEDTARRTSEEDIALRIRRIQFGQRLVAIMSIRNDSKNLTGAQIVQLVQDFSAINTAWLNGSIATSRALIAALTPDETILTTADKTAILAEIDANLASLGYEV